MAGLTGLVASNAGAGRHRIGSGEEDWALSSCPPRECLGQWLSIHLWEVPNLISTHWLSPWKLKGSRGRAGGNQEVPALG